MEMLRPENPQQLADALRESAARGETIRLGGNFSKDRLGGAGEPADVIISTSAMTELIQYEPRDLTISVSAGMPWAKFEKILRANRQFVPLDPGWNSTVGGVVAANLSGPRRRQYGTARDMIIGMKFATLEGKLVESGGMVVKNVAGLDMAKLMIGSFGTLAAIAVVNFKLFPMPAESQTFEMRFATAQETFAERDRILRGVLQPSAIDIVNWPSGFRLLIEAAGSAAVIERFARDLKSARAVDAGVWDEIREFTAHFLKQNLRGAVRTISVKLNEMADCMAKLEVPAIARAGSGAIYAHYAENAPEQAWNGDFATMEKIKHMFDPQRLLNRGRMHGRI